MTIRTLTIAGPALAAAIATTAGAAELKFANYMAATHPYVAGCFQPFAERVAQATEGGVTVRLFSGGELGPGPTEQYSRVVDGVAELAVSLPGYTASNFPLTLLAELPGVTDAASGTETIWANIDLLGSEYRRAHLVSLWSSAPNLLFTRDKPVRSPADVVGMKIRVPSRNAGLQVEAWGGSPVSMPVSDIYNALQTGVIDGAMIDGTAVGAFKLSEVASYITTGMDSTNSPFFILMNRDAYGDLEEAAKAAVDEAGRAASLDCNKVQLDVAAEGLEQFAAAPGKQVIELTEEEAAAFDLLSAAVTAQVVAESGDDAQAIVDALKAR
ncbi:TRAP-type C4-dicarboxylate transport system, substrate-binding protein [Paracoccus halophilus]|uniref:ABC transporter substrate-binding protein n=1 Tax=Paracoccus halophilus TaxID=376733 RepID=A0A099F8T6_9RHOB|nr:TRAP transporter substrate-binding protein [Paracoccus halophilus]KGJ06643.1 ABC transporter substrate-binding protein [Paracoccus halophilus]SFA42495.1 TRAP-type C4-dicarboxylate transport system, substrate-binding protein [Paracoccus halophilus]